MYHDATIVICSITHNQHNMHKNYAFNRQSFHNSPDDFDVVVYLQSFSLSLDNK